MSKTQYIILLAVIVAAITAAAFTVNSCNKPQETNTAELEKLVIQRINASDSLHKIALDSLLAISHRDSSHSVTINNIFNNGKQTKQEVIKKTFNSDYVNGIRNMLDSVYSANNR